MLARTWRFARKPHTNHPFALINRSKSMAALSCIGINVLRIRRRISCKHIPFLPGGRMQSIASPGGTKDLRSSRKDRSVMTVRSTKEEGDEGEETIITE